MEDDTVTKRNSLIYEEYLVGLKYRAKNQAVLFGLSYSRYKAILNEQKKLHRKLRNGQR